MTRKQAQNQGRRLQFSGLQTFIPAKNRLFFHVMVSAVVSLCCLFSGQAAPAQSMGAKCSILSCISSHGGKVTANPHIVRVQAPRPTTGTSVGPWHLVRTPAPENKETVSIMRTGELLKSDPDFAGLMIKCKGTAGLQIGFIVVSPFPPKSKPDVTISTGKSSLHFQASVAPPGKIVSLPDEASALLQGPWQSSRSLTVQIKGDGANIHGTVSLGQLSQAVALLQANCPVR